MLDKKSGTEHANDFFILWWNWYKKTALIIGTITPIIIYQNYQAIKTLIYTGESTELSCISDKQIALAKAVENLNAKTLEEDGKAMEREATSLERDIKNDNKKHKKN